MVKVQKNEITFAKRTARAGEFCLGGEYGSETHRFTACSGCSGSKPGGM
jgi:hypothetical protein